MGYCKEKLEKEAGEEGRSKRLLVAFAVWLGITILVSGLLDLFAKGFATWLYHANPEPSRNIIHDTLLRRNPYSSNLHRCRRLKGACFRKTLQRRVPNGSCRIRRTFPRLPI